MRRIRLVVTDLDGTLLDPRGCLTPRARAAIQALADAGVTLALATGRRWTGAAQAAAQFDFRGPLIAFDGAMIRSHPDGKILHAAPLDRIAAQRVADAMVRYGIQPIVQFSSPEEEFLHVAAEAANPEWTAAYLPAFRDQVRFCPAAELCSVASDPLRLAAFAPTTVLRRVAVDLASPNYGRQLLLIGNYAISELTFFSPLASKGSALATLARMLGIGLEETMAIGDGVNDVSMLRAVGLGVAMGHAPRRVRAAAHVVTASNAEDGVAKALETYVLGR
ncbi:MAG: HAD family hydrolase [Nitrososphaerota archaeon]